MNVNIERGTPIGEIVENLDNKDFSGLLDLLGMVGGYDPETFEAEKQAIIESGVSYEDFMSILGSAMSDKLGVREITDVYVQKLTETATLPAYAHVTDGCADIYSDETVTIEPHETKLVSTGIAMAIPEGYVVHIYPRSSIGVKTPLRLANSVGVIDAGYRDEIKIIYTNISDEPYTINIGERIAQMSIDLSPIARFNVVDDVKEIGEDRGGGFGSTGA